MLSSFTKTILLPKSTNEDLARQEFILNVFIIGAVSILIAAVVESIINLLFGDTVAYFHGALPLTTLGVILSFLLGLYFLSRTGRIHLASYLLLGTFFLLAAYVGYSWGVDVPSVILLYVLTIIMGGVLIGTRFAFLITIAVTAYMAVMGVLQEFGGVVPNRYWRTDVWTYTDSIVAGVIFLTIATVAWLSNREIEKSLMRARRSEAELKEERDTLEVRVEERTRELRQAEMEKMSQAYHLVEFGRLAGGIFHDLMNPLAALSLNIDRIADTSGTRATMSGDVARAKRAAAHMQKLMESMRKHLSREGSAELFSPRQSLKEVCQVLSSYANARDVRICVRATESPQIYGDPVAFTQVITNLVSNAVQSYPPRSSKGEARDVVMGLEVREEGVCITVKDQGSGITPEDLPHVFEPFFTTKDSSQGLGIGLSLAKRIVEKSFGGRLTVDSSLGKGSTFTVYLPVREP